jgi:hypothetical protein
VELTVGELGHPGHPEGLRVSLSDSLPADRKSAAMAASPLYATYSRRGSVHAAAFAVVGEYGDHRGQRHQHTQRPPED